MKTTLLLVSTLLIIIPSKGYAIDLKAQVDPFARPLVDNGVAVGLVVGIFKGGETQILPYGETRKGTGDAPDGETIYEIGSVSKAFTGVLLADMVATGDVKLDDPLQKFVKLPVPVQGETPITLEHLATHTSGLPTLPDNFRPADPGNPYVDYTAQQMGAFLAGHQLRRGPGEYEYSNFGMGMLGYLLARQQRMNYEQLLIARIAKPAGMVDTCITLNKAQRERLAPPYDGELRPAKNWILPTLAGAGGIRSTANDMLKFIAANLSDEDTQLARSMRQSHEKRYTIPGGAIGLGWHIYADNMTRWHNGGTGGYSSWVSVVPEFDAGVVVLANTHTDKITELGLQLTSLVCGVTVEPPAGRKAVAAEPGKGDPAELEPYVGVYEITPDFAIDVTVEDGKVIAQATGQGRLFLDGESATKFSVRGVDAKITFVRGDDGKFSRLILHQNGANRVAVRKVPKKDVPAAVLEAYVGDYAITPEFVMTVTVEDGQLILQATGQGKLEFFPESPRKFFCKVVDAKITFMKGANGKVNRLILHQNGANQVAKRM